MPEEMLVLDRCFYSMYKLHAMHLMVYIAEQTEVVVWESNEADSRLRAGLDLLVPCTDPNESCHS